MKKNNKLANIISLIINIILIFLIIFLLVSKYNSKEKATNILGNYIFKVATGSMEPTIKIGDIILVKRSKEYKINDIITYETKGIYVTHRIIDIKDNKYITKGDANNTADKGISKKEIIGKYIKNLVIIRIILDFIVNDYLFIIGIFIIIYLIIIIIKYLIKTKK